MKTHLNLPAYFPPPVPAVDTDKYRFGTTKLFLRANVLHRLDGIANKVKMNAIIKIQAILRGHSGRCSYLESRRAVITSQAVARSWLARRLHGEMLRRLEGQRVLARHSTKVRKQKQALKLSENEALEAGVQVAGMEFVVSVAGQRALKDYPNVCKKIGTPNSLPCCCVCAHPPPLHPPAMFTCCR